VEGTYTETLVSESQEEVTKALWEINMPMEI
jgi:hypothetical protein